MSPENQRIAIPPANDWLGVSVSINDSPMDMASISVPALSSGCPALCEGCGELKMHRGKEASSLVCCSKCWRRLPKWMRNAFMTDQRRPNAGARDGASTWENRIAVTLLWMRDTTRGDEPSKL